MKGRVKGSIVHRRVGRGHGCLGRLGGRRDAGGMDLLLRRGCAVFFFFTFLCSVWSCVVVVMMVVGSGGLKWKRVEMQCAFSLVGLAGSDGTAALFGSIGGIDGVMEGSYGMRVVHGAGV